MKTQESTKKLLKSTPKPRLRMGLVLIIVTLIIFGSAFWYMFGWLVIAAVTPNYAEQVAKPLETALIKAGAVKKCSRGDNGKGPDNRQPWYEGNYQLTVGYGQALTIVDKVAANHGYHIEHASPQNRGPLNLPDKFIDKWFFDSARKQHTYDDLQSGVISLTGGVNAEGSVGACGQGELIMNNTHSVVHIYLALPNFKQ